jgi:hypothetical protein
MKKNNPLLLKFYKSFLNYFWLRPENAILCSFRALDFNRVLKKYIKKNDKIIDVACGDGVYSFIAAEGELDADFDTFQSILNKKRTSKFDAYDYFNNKLKVKVKKKPKYLFDTGTDWKNNLLKKANILKFYKKLIIHNNEKKLKLENKYKLVFSNSAYWVKGLSSHLNDMKELTEKNGYIYLQMKFKEGLQTTMIKNNTKINFGKIFFDIIDAGRFATWRGLKTKKEFDKILKSNKDLQIISYKPLYGGIIGNMWDIGLRPLFKPLAELIKNTKINKLSKIKKEWVNILYELTSYFMINYKPNKKNIMEYTILFF